LDEGKRKYLHYFAQYDMSMNRNTGKTKIWMQCFSQN
jgi:hypothetical protein